MRLALALAVAGAAAVVATTAYGRGAAAGARWGLGPETAAAVGTRHLWVLEQHTLLRSTDGGNHFSPVARPPLPSVGTVPTVEFANPHDGFAYVRYGSRLYVTHDGGEGWHPAGPAGNVIAFSVGGGDAYVVTSRGIFERSSVAKDQWRSLRLPAFKPGYMVSLAANGSRVWLLGPQKRRHADDTDELALSRDRGNDFAARKGPCEYELGGTLVPAADGVVWAVCPTGMMAGLMLSTDGGRSFPVIRSVHDPGGLRLPSLTNAARIAAPSTRVAVLSGGGGGALLRTTDEGRHWRRISETARIEQVFWLAFTTRRDGFAVVVTAPRIAQLWRTTDAGATWHSMPIR